MNGISILAAPTLSSIAVTTGSLPIPVGGMQQFIAMGTYSNYTVQDLTDIVTWSSSAPRVATVAPGGIAKGIYAGSTTIKATLGSVSGSLAVTAAQNSNPVLSWCDPLSMSQTLSQMRERYIHTKDPLPNMNYVQLEKALPESPEIPGAETEWEDQEIALPEEVAAAEVESQEAPQEIYEEEIPPEEVPPEEVPPEEIPPEETGETAPVEETPQSYVRLAPSKGSVGEEISVEADWGLSEITEVYVNGYQAEFVPISDTNLVFAIPPGATTGYVEFVGPRGSVVSAEALEVV